MTDTPQTKTHWTETPLDKDPPPIPLDRDRDPQSCDLWCMLGQRPPSFEQND